MANPNQRDIVEVYFCFDGDSEEKPHMVIVLSAENAINQEDGAFLGMVLTSSVYYDDEFSFWITDAMVHTPFTKITQARVHLIQLFQYRDIIKNNYRNSIQRRHFDQVIAQMNDVVFGVS